MPVDINNTFNSAEDKVQYALGTMQAYSIVVKYQELYTIVLEMCYSGIIALTPEEALIKIVSYRALKDNLDHQRYEVSLCE